MITTFYPIFINKRAMLEASRKELDAQMAELKQNDFPCAYYSFAHEAVLLTSKVPDLTDWHLDHLSTITFATLRTLGCAPIRSACEKELLLRHKRAPEDHKILTVLLGVFTKKASVLSLLQRTLDQPRLSKIGPIFVTLALNSFSFSSYPEYLRGIALISVAIQGCYTTAQILLASGPITNTSRGEAFIGAAENGHREIVDLLWDSKTISDSFHGRAIIKAAESGHSDIIRYLLTLRPLSDKDYRKWAIEGAAKNGHKSTVELLLTTGSLSDMAREEIILSAAAYGQTEIIELFSYQNLSDETRERAMQAALDNGHISVADLLVPLGRLKHRIPAECTIT